MKIIFFSKKNPQRNHLLMNIQIRKATGILYDIFYEYTSIFQITFTISFCLLIKKTLILLHRINKKLQPSLIFLKCI